MKKRHKFYLISLPLIVLGGMYLFLGQLSYLNKISKIRRDKKRLLKLAENNRSYKLFSAAFPKAKAYYTKENIDNYKGIKDGVTLIGIHSKNGTPLTQYRCNITPIANRVKVKLSRLNIYPARSQALDNTSYLEEASEAEIINELKTISQSLRLPHRME